MQAIPPQWVETVRPRHPLLARLISLPEDDATAVAVIEQIYESALLIEGLHPDPASMLPRIQQLMEKALDS